MIKRIVRALAVTGGVVGLTLTTPRAVSAQGKVELTPFVGNYYALTKIATDFFGDGSNFELRQLNAVAYGGRFTFWVSRTMGVEAAATFNKSEPRLLSGDTVSFTFKGNILLASGRLLYRPARTNLHAIIGMGIVRRGGEAWKGGEKLTKPAVVLGMGVRAAVTPKFALNVNVEGNIYSFDPDGSGTANTAKTQADLVVSIGVPISLGH